MRKVIGITGGIASGKTSVTNYIRSLGFKVIDADLITHELYKKGNKGYNAIQYLFGEDFAGDEMIDRDSLRKLVFNDLEKLKVLNQTMHPIIYEEIKKELEKYGELVFVDVPLLYEAGFETLCDKVIVVYVPRDVQVDRLCQRDGIKKFDAIQKISKQSSTEEKKERADYVIDNSMDIDFTLHQVDVLMERLMNE